MKTEKPERLTYKYYLLGETVPVRVVFNEKGLHSGAEVLDREKGKLVPDATYLGRILNSFEVDEITEQEFIKRCDDFLGKKLG